MRYCFCPANVMGKFNRHKPNGQMTREPPHILNDSWKNWRPEKLILETWNHKKTGRHWKAKWVGININIFIMKTLSIIGIFLSLLSLLCLVAILNLTCNAEKNVFLGVILLFICLYFLAFTIVACVKAFKKNN
jgi:hypothetical protein